MNRIMTMDWQRKFEALKAISPDACLRMRKPDDWYCSLPGVELKDRCTLRTVRGDYSSPEGAVIEAFLNATNLKAGEYLVINAMDPKRRRAVTWNGFMWADVEEEAAA